MSTVIFVGGPTACGKSTFTTMLNASIEKSLKYRRVEGFYEIAKEKGIEDNIFGSIPSSLVDDWFINKCMENEVLISDVHYAVQMKRITEDGINIKDPYVPTISSSLLDKLKENDIRIKAIFLDCTPGECMDRAAKRYKQTKKDRRNISIEDSMYERHGEMNAWKKLTALAGVEGYILNTEKYKPEELVEQFLNSINDDNVKILLKNDK